MHRLLPRMRIAGISQQTITHKLLPRHYRAWRKSLHNVALQLRAGYYVFGSYRLLPILVTRSVHDFGLTFCRDTQSPRVDVWHQLRLASRKNNDNNENVKLFIERVELARVWKGIDIVGDLTQLARKQRQIWIPQKHLYQLWYASVVVVGSGMHYDLRVRDRFRVWFD